MKAGWETKPLGELCNIELGKTPDRSNPAYWDAKGATDNVWLSIADLLRAENRIISDSKEYVSDKGAALCKVVPEGTLLVSFKLTLGRLAFAGRDLLTNEAIAALTIHNEHELSKEFLFYCLTFFDWVKAAETDVKLKGMTLNKAKLKLIPISFPPPDEQRRIVTLLDEAFADIATAKANSEKNLQNARDLLESHLQAAFSKQTDWEMKTFGELAEFRNGINFNKSSKGNEIKIVGVRDFQKNFWTPLDDLETIIPDGDIPASDLIESGDLLFVRSNGNPELIGRSLLVGDLHERITHSGFTIKARLRDTQLSPIYLCHFLKSGLLRREMIEGGNGANIKSLNQGTLSRLKIAFPDKSKQMVIVEHLETVQAEIAELESIYRQKLTALEDLKKSLLHQAFSGQL